MRLLEITLEDDSGSDIMSELDGDGGELSIGGGLGSGDAGWIGGKGVESDMKDFGSGDMPQVFNDQCAVSPRHVAPNNRVAES